MKKEEKPPKPPLVKAEVIDHFISLHMGENRYEVFRKGAIVDIEPVTFRNLERKGRVVRAGASRTGDSDAGVADVVPEKKQRRKTKTAPPAGDDAVPC